MGQTSFLEDKSLHSVLACYRTNRLMMMTMTIMVMKAIVAVRMMMMIDDRCLLMQFLQLAIYHRGKNIFFITAMAPLLLRPVIKWGIDLHYSHCHSESITKNMSSNPTVNKTIKQSDNIISLFWFQMLNKFGHRLGKFDDSISFLTWNFLSNLLLWKNGGHEGGNLEFSQS